MEFVTTRGENTVEVAALSCANKRESSSASRPTEPSPFRQYSVRPVNCKPRTQREIRYNVSEPNELKRATIEEALEMSRKPHADRDPVMKAIKDNLLRWTYVRHATDCPFDRYLLRDKALELASEYERTGTYSRNPAVSKGFRHVRLGG